ncbi:MAG: hypothetical protein HRT88_11920 [Lentisphaeraceae bacterium]|nr:hypothetical protein [Lentisphaeraceae bacterium]
MKDICSTCFKNFEVDSGCYSTPSGLFCVLCYEGKEVLKYEQLARHSIHSREDHICPKLPRVAGLIPKLDLESKNKE